MIVRHWKSNDVKKKKSMLYFNLEIKTKVKASSIIMLPRILCY